MRPSAAVLLSPALRQFALSSAISAAAMKAQAQVDEGLSSFLLSSLAASSPILRGTRVAQSLKSLSWTLILQASLVLSVLTIQHQNRLSQKPLSASSTRSNATTLSSLLVAFGFGTIGSIAGAFAGMLALSAVLKSEVAGSWAMAAAALLSSYIGGTSNYFETASVLTRTAEDSSLLTVIAGADIFMMIAYFAFLLGSQPLLSRVLPKAKNLRQGPGKRFYGLSQKQSTPTKTPSSVDSIKCITFSIAISSLANKLATFSPVVGVSVPLSTMGALLASRVPLFKKLGVLVPGERSASAMLCLFYAVIGLDCKLQDLATVGLPILTLMSTMLATHYLTIVALAIAWNRLLATMFLSRGTQLDAETVIIASNVCIGGASTASSMASSLEPRLVVPASIVGVLGYIIGTPIGLSAAKSLARITL